MPIPKRAPQLSRGESYKVVSPQSPPEVVWDDSQPVRANYAAVAAGLEHVSDDLYVSEASLVSVTGNKVKQVTRDALFAAIVERIDLIRLTLSGKRYVTSVPACHLKGMLATPCFLDSFPIIDFFSATPVFTSDWVLANEPGYNAGTPGNRVYVLSDDAVQPASTTEAITPFLDQMDFATAADRTAAVALLLTVLLRNHFPCRPIGVVTSTKSHGGKETIVFFAACMAPVSSVTYQPTSWALEMSVHNALRENPLTGVLNVDNARTNGASQIASSVIERMATDSSPVLFSSKAKESVRCGKFVMTITSNQGSVSEDILNRSLLIALNPLGDVASRDSKSGNPRLEYLPNHREQIFAEAIGMVVRWIRADQPLDIR